MKTCLCLFAAACVFGFTVSSKADTPVPNERRIVNYQSNGTPVYAVYECVGYDMARNPMFRWVTHSSVVHHYASSGRRYYRPSYSRSYNYASHVHFPVSVVGHGAGYTGHTGGSMGHSGGYTGHSGGAHHSGGSSGGGGSHHSGGSTGGGGGHMGGGGGGHHH